MSFEIRGKMNGIKFPCFAELKYDGEYVEYQNGVLINKYGNKRENCPITQELKLFKPELSYILMGELYYGSGKDGSLYELLSHKNDPSLRYAIFDVKLVNATLSYRERREWLLENFQSTQHCHIIETGFVENKEELLHIYTDAVEFGWEGIVVKNQDAFGTNSWVKMKAKQTADLMIQNISPDQERIEVAVPLPNSKLHKLCGVKVPDKIKKTLKVGDMVEIEYQCQLPSGSLRHPVFKRQRPNGKVVSMV